MVQNVVEYSYTGGLKGFECRVTCGGDGGGGGGGGGELFKGRKGR